MNNLFFKIAKHKVVAIAAATLLLTSCNKGFEDVPSATTTTVSSQNLAEKINSDPNYSIFRDALSKYNLLNRLSNQGGQFTVLAMDNPTMTAVLAGFGLTPATFVGAGAGNPAALAPVFNYHVIPQNVPASNMPTSYSAATTLYPAQIPNTQLPSSFQISSVSGLPVMMNIFLAKNGANAFANTIPITAPDALVGNNGVVHKVAGPVMPASSMLKNYIDTATNLTYLKAAIARADSGQAVGTTNQLDFVLGYAPANLTVFAPTDAAFKTLLTGQITLALIAQGMSPATASATATALASTPAVFSNPALASVLTPTTVRGMVVYHILGNRAYSTNLPLSTTLVKTLLNSAIPAHPGVTVDRTNPAPRLLGAANGGSYSNFVTTDRMCINGVLHIIDQVLRPQ